MTISTQARSAGPFTCNGATTVFPFTYKVFAASDVVVVLRIDSTGTEVKLVLGVDYNVTLNANQNTSPGGTVTTLIAFPAGQTITLTSAVPYLQPTDLTNQGGFYPAVINSALDRLTIFAQQVLGLANRALKFPISDGNLDATVPGKDQRKGRVLAFHETTGLPVVGPNIADVGTVGGSITAIQTVAANIADVNTVADYADEVAEFNATYQGAKATDPTTRNNGDPLQSGDLYFNTFNKALRTYTGTQWQEAITGSVAVQRFTGDGTAVNFQLNSAPDNENVVQVFIGGVYQSKTEYDITGTNKDVLTFTVAPPNGAAIEAVTFSVLPLGVVDASQVQMPGGGSLNDYNAQSCVAGIKGLIAVSGRRQHVLGFYVGANVGGGQFYFDTTVSKSSHNGGTVIAPEAIAAWAGTEADILTLLNWTGAGTGCFVRIVEQDYLKPSQFGGTESIANNAPIIQKCYDVAASRGLELKYDLMYPTTGTVNYNVENMCTSGVGQPRWRDASSLDVGIQYNGTTNAPAILITQGTAHHSWYKVRGTRNVAGAHNIQIGQAGVVSSGTIIDFVGIASQRAGGSGFAILGNNAGESCKWLRGEASGCVGSGVYLARTDTTMNNAVFDKFNSHRNDADGLNFASGVQRLLVTGGCDFTLNVGAGVAFRSVVDFDSVIENNWFENNGTDILLDCDASFRGVTSRGNKLAEATNQAIYCKNGAIKSIGDKFNNTPIGVRFDVTSAISVVRPGQVSSVTTMYSGDTSFLSHLPFEGCVLREHLFTINNVPASQTNQVIPKVTGGTFYDVKPNMPFYRLRVRLTGVTATTGTMTINLVKNSATNRNNFFTTVIDAAATTAGSKETTVLFGSNSFVSSSNFTNFFLVYTTTSDWNGTTGRVDVTVEAIDLL